MAAGAPKLVAAVMGYVLGSTNSDETEAPE